MSERRAIFLGRLRRLGREETGAEEEVIEIEPGALSGIFAAPKWGFRGVWEPPSPSS